ncbi:MAG: hypothetical protein ACRDT0_12170, partial [Pseudonocardiaceae bacterium]
VSNLATGAGGAGHFAVDMDKLPQLRKDLEAVRDIYDDIYVKSLRLRDLTAPGRDRVSTRAAEALSEMSGDGEGQLGGCAKAARDRMDEAIAEIDRILAGYRQAEESSEMRP